MPKHIKFNKEQIEYIINAYQNDKKSLQTIADEFNISISPIKRVLKENNMEIRKAGGQSEDLTL